MLADGSWAAYQGKATDRAQSLLQQHCGATHVRLCSSGTMAVELALRAAGVQTGDEVILSALDYPGNFRSIELLGARPVLVDTLPRRWDADPAAIERNLGQQTRALIVSHLYGSMAAIDQLRQWADAHRVVLVEDACQCPGALVQGRPVGRWGHFGIFSFGGSKPLTAGNGGALVTDDPLLDQRVRSLAMRPSDAVPLSQLQAAVLIPQLIRLPDLAAQRRAAAAQLISACPGTSGWQAADWQPRDALADFYKLAWIAPHAEARQAAVQLGAQWGLPVGVGFATFGRRSLRRCRRDAATENADRGGDCSLVLDHRALLGSGAELQRLADQINRLQQMCC